MIEVRIFLDNGDKILTRMNCSEQEAKSYYLGNVFNIGAKSDKIAKCIKVDVVEAKDDTAD